MQRMQSEIQDAERKTRDNLAFTDVVVDILQHLAQHEQGELDWALKLRERPVGQ